MNYETKMTADEFDDHFAIALADELKTNNTLTGLALSLCYMDQGAHAIAESLHLNSTLTMLDIMKKAPGSQNLLSDGCVALLQAAVASSSINLIMVAGDNSTSNSPEKVNTHTHNTTCTHTYTHMPHTHTHDS